MKRKKMSGAHRIAVSELSVSSKFKNLKGKEYLNSVKEEMLECDEGSEEDIVGDKKQGVSY